MSTQKSKPTIFLAGDSTMMSYSRGYTPEKGWGQELYRHFTERSVHIYHSPGSIFPDAITYETSTYKIDNRALGARSTKTFLEEGRMDDMLPAMRSGDLFLIQFGHNDANVEKTERYVTPAQYQEKLENGFILPSREKGVQPVLMSPIAQRMFDENGICHPSFPAYREAARELAGRLGLPFIDMGKLTADYNTRVGEEACKGIYMHLYPGLYVANPEGLTDNTHLQYGGAYLFAGLVAKELVRLGLIPEDTLVKDPTYPDEISQAAATGAHLL